ncbi:hypothetical protein VKT23_008982 [Stygiomarasmius scandens]|uniref:Carboxylic ester hydrolase n=1 Tax=Marasmiellus scandens TaxID=2682957 RepID=A0ABR1JIN3_9AGAR
MKLLYRVIQLLFTLTTVNSACSPESDLVVDLGYARYQGVRNNNTSNVDFLGLRYAKSPAGPLRWKAPQAPDLVSDLQLADSQPPMCRQAPFGNASTSPFRNLSSVNEKRDIAVETPSEDEDCLFLNVYVPGSQFDNNTDSNLPVLVWIHGGGYHFGSASNSGVPGATGPYDGESLLQASNDQFVVVVIQYRLGLFGFLAGEAIKDNGSLNAGLLDQQFALQWIQEHISKFGGDPCSVVIWGESAGAGSVLNHVVANDGQTNPSLFNGAISSSLFLPPYYQYNDIIPETVFTDVVNQTNCTDAQDTLSCLRNIDGTLLSAINIQIVNAAFFGTFVFSPVIDGSFITQRPSELLTRGQLNGARFLAFSNSFEGVIFTEPAVNDVLEFVKNLFPEISDDTATQIVATYPQSNSGASVFDVAAQIYGESTFICPTYYFLDAVQGRSYKGQFAIPPALHGDDVFYYFTSLQRPSPPIFNNTDFQKAFTQSFLTFASSADLDPNDKFDENIVPEWPIWDKTNAEEMLFNRTDDFQPIVQVIKTDEGLLTRCNFWRNITSETSQ